MTNYLTKNQVAQITSFSLRTVHRWIKSGLLPCMKLGRSVRVAASELEKFLATFNRK